MSPEDEAIRGREAQQFLDSSLFVQVKEHIEGQLAAQRRKAGIKDTDLHTRLIITEQVWGSFQNFFTRLAQSGKIADIEIEERKRGIFRR